MVDDKDGKSVTWKCWMTRSKGYRRSMAFFVERRGVDGGIDREAEPQPQPEPADDGRLGAIFALRSALTGKYLVTSTGMMDRWCLQAKGSKPEDAAVFQVIPLPDDGFREACKHAAEYLCSLRLLGEKRLLGERRFLRLKQDGHVVMSSVSDADNDIRHDRMAIALEHLLPRASYELTVQEDCLGIVMSRDLPMKVLGIKSKSRGSSGLAEPNFAEGTGRVHVGDSLTSVNGQGISSIASTDIIQTLTCTRPVVLGFTVPRDVRNTGVNPSPAVDVPVKEKRTSYFSGFRRRTTHQSDKVMGMSAQLRGQSDAIIEL